MKGVVEIRFGFLPRLAGAGGTFLIEGKVLEEVVRRYGPDIVIVNDNGSENMGKAGAFPNGKEIIQYRSTPHATGKSLTLSALSGLFSGSARTTTTSR